MDYRKMIFVRKVVFIVLFLIILFPIVQFCSKLALETMGETVETSERVNIYPVVKQDKFTILQTVQKKFLASDVTKYSLLADNGEGKKQVEYDTSEVSIKDTLASSEQAYAEIKEKKNNIAILEKQIILYIPKDYDIQIK